MTKIINHQGKLGRERVKEERSEKQHPSQYRDNKVPIVTIIGALIEFHSSALSLYFSLRGDGFF
jgi:hypothetical protein